MVKWISLAVLIAIVGALLASLLWRGDVEDGSFSPADVRQAFADSGLVVNWRNPLPDQFADAAAERVLLPENEAFVVFVAKSDADARVLYEPYARDTDPGTFEILKGNVIVEADGSNGERPLPGVVRARIRAALEKLGPATRS